MMSAHALLVAVVANALLLVVLLTGCGDQKYSVWSQDGRAGDRVLMEKGLDHTACEVVVQRLERAQNEKNETMRKAELAPDGWRYWCEPD